jgi:hypothetical protein
MNRGQVLQNAWRAACLAVGLIVTQPSKAVELGFSEYFLGLAIPMSGYVPPPGAYFQDTFLFYRARITPTDVQLVFNIAQVGYFLDTELFGATLGFAVTIPFLGATNSVPASFTDPSGIVRRYRQIADISSLSDTEYSAVLGWHTGDHNWCVVLTGFAPTGNYEPGRLVQTGLNRPALDIKGAYTFLNLQTGTEVSTALGTILNALNTATNYQSGIELHFEWALNQHFPFGLAAGVGGYFYQQLTNDYGTGDLVGPYRGRVAAVGPLLSYTIKAGDNEVNLSSRWFHEFAAKNHVRGDSLFMSLSFKL